MLGSLGQHRGELAKIFPCFFFATLYIYNPCLHNIWKQRYLRTEILTKRSKLYHFPIKIFSWCRLDKNDRCSTGRSHSWWSERRSKDSNKPPVSSCSCRLGNTTVMTEKLMTLPHLELLSQPQSPSQQPGSRRQDQQKVRRTAEKYNLKLLMGLKSEFYTSAIKIFQPIRLERSCKILIFQLSSS